MDKPTPTGHMLTNKLHMCATDPIGHQLMVVMESVLDDLDLGTNRSFQDPLFIKYTF